MFEIMNEASEFCVYTCQRLFIFEKRNKLNATTRLENH